MLKNTLAALIAVSLSTVSTAQFVAQGTLIGFRSGATPLIERQVTCNPVQRVCPTGMASASGHAGGAAYNAIRSSLWHTQGTRMAEIGIRDCALLCSVAAELTLGAGSVATGLSVCESQRALYQVESIPGAAALHRFHIRSCPPQVVASCRFRLPTNQHVCGAVAVDDEHGLIYYAASVFSSLAAPANQILVAKMSDPCNIGCRIDVPACGNSRLGPITAMTYDACTDQVYVSDGIKVTILRAADPASCAMREVACCSLPTTGAQRWHGFDIETPHAEAVGRNCIGVNCRPCTNMVMRPHGDPAVGNPAFAVSIDNAQAGANALLIAGIGRCAVPGLPYFCGQLHTPGPIIVLPLGTISGTGCAGTVTANLPIPKDYNLCGFPLCVQGVVFDANAFGLCVAITNAIGLRIGT